MTTKHTPGPWEVSKHGTPESHPQYGIYTGSKNDHVIVKGDDALADTLLIAAAPELLEALQIWMRFFDTMPKGQFGGISCDIGLMNDGFIKSKRAIAKATGEMK